MEKIILELIQSEPAVFNEINFKKNILNESLDLINDEINNFKKNINYNYPISELIEEKIKIENELHDLGEFKIIRPAIKYKLISKSNYKKITLIVLLFCCLGIIVGVFFNFLH